VKQLSEILVLHQGDDVFKKFELAAHELLKFWVIRKGEATYDICEIEFFLHSNLLQHEDPYVIKSSTQQTFGHWMFHQGGAEVTIGEANRYGSIQLRTVRDRKTGAFHNGPQRVFKVLFEDGGNALHQEGGAYLERKEAPSRAFGVISAPRVGLNLTEFSEQMDERIDFLLRPYRFIASDIDDFAEKYVAFLFMYRISKVEHGLQMEQTIFNKYIKAFEHGYQSRSLEAVWEERSKSLRLGRLLGRMHKMGEVIEPILSNVDLPT
jgi:hypothetical protein